MLDLGIFVKDNKVISHRSILKIFLNPFLRRYFGIAISSIVKDFKFRRYTISKQSTNSVIFHITVNFEYDYKVKG